MSKIMEFVVTIKDENGETIVSRKSVRNVPYIEEIEENGFRAAFNDFETAALELTNETRAAAVSDYLSEASKKKQSQRGAQEEPS